MLLSRAATVGVQVALSWRRSLRPRAQDYAVVRGRPSGQGSCSRPAARSSTISATSQSRGHGPPANVDQLFVRGGLGAPRSAAWPQAGRPLQSMACRAGQVLRETAHLACRRCRGGPTRTRDHRVPPSLPLPSLISQRLVLNPADSHLPLPAGSTLANPPSGDARTTLPRRHAGATARGPRLRRDGSHRGMGVMASGRMAVNAPHGVWL